MPRFRRISREVEAFTWDGTHYNATELQRTLGTAYIDIKQSEASPHGVTLYALCRDEMWQVHPGDWIVVSFQGNLKVLKREDFENKYERI